jgi:hypothetical protein
VLARPVLLGANSLTAEMTDEVSVPWYFVARMRKIAAGSLVTP